MLNEEKIALMTKMAIYEEGEGKKSIPMSKYYKSDYMSLRIINAIIVTTIVYFIVLAAVLFINMEWLLENLVSMDFLDVGKKLLIVYVAVIGANVVMTYIVSLMRFKKYRKGLNGYNHNLKKLYHISRQEGKRAERVKGGTENGYI